MLPPTAVAINEDDSVKDNIFLRPGALLGWECIRNTEMSRYVFTEEDAFLAPGNCSFVLFPESVEMRIHTREQRILHS